MKAYEYFRKAVSCEERAAAATSSTAASFWRNAADGWRFLEKSHRALEADVNGPASGDPQAAKTGSAPAP